MTAAIEKSVPQDLLRGVERTPWTPEEDQVAITLRDKGKTVGQIACVLDRTVWAITTRFRVLDRRSRPGPEESRKPKSRPCQVCKQTFTPSQLGIIYCSPSCRLKSRTFFQHL